MIFGRGKRPYWPIKIEQFIKDGRGQGEGTEYKPWLQIGDFSSQGCGHRIRDHITGCIHHLFSDLEANYYHILAWADAVIDIREQYPLLPRDATESIAEKLGYRHPKEPLISRGTYFFILIVSHNCE